ncbi:hypothetical protein J437_LFUL000952 [Ladona fulva]|uniref:long-chain-fatty-acid--CoA ligase n=1 Tax=Ladona fulva TaxID=123851 RepID=A0A8K0NYT1_LADFU|nr:hypothetical protein J437_LFUL000952 [Ladona fulva]
MEEGPDVIIETTERTTYRPDGAVLISYEEGDVIDPPSISVPTAFKIAVDKHPQRIALGEKENKKWNYITYEKYYSLVRLCAKAFIKLGLPRFRSVCIMGYNSSEWIISCLGAIHAGGFACGIYATNTAEATKRCMIVALCSIAVLEDEDQVAKVLQIKDSLPDLLKIVQYKGTPKEEGWNELLDIGRGETDEELENRLRGISINQCAQLTFTSGTTGDSKAVMLSHDNLLSGPLSLRRYMNIRDHEITISYLPLSHVAAASVDIYMGFIVGATTYLATKDIWRGGIVRNLREIKPTTLVGVPRIFEKMYERLVEIKKRQSRLKKWIANYANSTMLEKHTNKSTGLPPRYSSIRIKLSTMILRILKKKMGLNKCKHCVSAAAPLSIEIQKFFYGLDIAIAPAYGLTESTGAFTLNLDCKLGSVGKACPDMRLKLGNQDDSGEGEIRIKGRIIFMGYLNNAQDTKEAFDEEGWFKTGDLGKVDSEGFIYITGRIKELLCTAGGENVAPIPIEDRIKQLIPAVNYAIVIGDKEKFLSALLTLKRTPDKMGLPSDELSDEVKAWCQRIGSKSKTIQDIIAPDTLVEKEISKVIEEVNRDAISRAQIVQKFKILPTDFTLTYGELGPTMKLRRNIIINKYKDYIDEIYERKQS